MKEDKLDQVLGRLDVIVSLMLESNPHSTLTDKIVRLHGLGLSSSEIARILRKPGNQIRDVLAKQRKKKATN